MAMPAKRMVSAECPECETKIRFAQAPQIGETVTCSECGEILQVISLSPLELDWAYDDDYEEWDEEEWEDDEEWDDEEDDEYEYDEED